MAKSVPSNVLPKPGEFRSPFDLRFLQALLVVRPPCDRICKKPILVSGEDRNGAPLQQHLRQTSIERNIVSRIFRLHVVHPSAHHASLDQNRAIPEIEIAPLQAQNLADAKAQALCDQNHRSVRFAQMLEQFKELVHVEDSWPLEPLASILHAHQRDRVLALWGVIPYGESCPRRSQILNIPIKTVAFGSPLQWGPTFGALVERWYTLLNAGLQIEESFSCSKNSAASGEGPWGSPMIWR